MSERFFVESPISGTTATLQDAEAHHLLHVMRADVGSEVVLFDGSGAEFPARITSLGRSRVDLEILSRREIDRELPVYITLGVALPKGDRQRWLIEKVTELGVAHLVPLQSARSIAQPAEKALGRLRRAVVEACKQCGRNELMTIAPVQTVADFCGLPDDGDCKCVADPGGPAKLSTPASTPQRIFLAVGPEGGFAQGEIEAFQSAGWSIVSLGARILRVETAALALVAKLTD